MDKQALKALKGSIKKWRGVIDKSVEDKGPDNCPLCMLFRIRNRNTMCKGCPVAKRTHAQGCRKTPYEDLDDHYVSRCIGCPLCDYLAKKELDFLKSLLPKRRK